MKEKGITHVLTAGSGLKSMYPNSLKYKILEVLDLPSKNIYKHLPTAIKFIKASIKAGGTVFVHCYAGISRSATCVMAYLMTYYKKSFNDAFIFVKSRRK